MGTGPSAGLIEGGDGKLYGTTESGGAHGCGVVFRMDRPGTGYTVLHHFGGAPNDGNGWGGAGAALAESGGVLYGTTHTGGSDNLGTVFKINRDGTGYAVLHHFGAITNDGRSPLAGITIGSEGKLYGVTQFGVRDGGGAAVFTLNTDGSGYTVIHDLGDHRNPLGTLVEISNRLYGTSYAGGANGKGTVFRVNKDGSDLVVLHSFQGAPNDGSGSSAGLLVGSDGAVYGTSLFGGTADRGTVFKMNLDGSGYRVLRHFGGSGDGLYPRSSLAEHTNGKIYGTARAGGATKDGVAFRMNKDGSGYEVLHHFNPDTGDGDGPEGTLLCASDGALYGTTRAGGAQQSGSISQGAGTIFKFEPDGSGYATLRSFLYCGGDGGESGAPLLSASDGYLYSTTRSGGAYDFGVIYKVRRDGSGYQILHQFDYYSGYDLELIEGSDGILYGTTRYGGGARAGTIFKLNKDGSGYTIVHRFEDIPGAVWYRAGSVMEGSDGKLYGRRVSDGISGGFTIFSINRDGSDFETLHHAPMLNNSSIHDSPNLIEGSDGALYGTGYANGNHQAGSVFKINKDGTGYTVLHHFNYDNGDGNNPEGGVIEGGDGKLYGTTTYGGALDFGIVFRIDKDGSGYTVLRDFDEPTHPVGNLHEGPGGVLYGVTYAGTLYMINRDGSGFAVLHGFTGRPNGLYPKTSVVRGPDRGIYGTTIMGGSLGCGCIYRIAPISLAISKETPGYRLHITGVAGQHYAIERADSLSSGSGWAQIGTADNLTGTVEFLDSTPNGQKFYRCRLLLP